MAQLNLSCNCIKILPKFPASLQLLDLRNNEISFIDDKVFSGLTNVLGIDLAHNKINRIFPSAFKNNAKLQVLQLGYNSISLLVYNMFPLKSSLNKLFLEHNNISNIPIFPKEYFPRLRIIDISNNKLKRIVSGNFDQDPLFPESVEELYLAQNEIFYIKNFVFQRPSLRYVDLRDNRIQSLSNLALVPSENNLKPVLYHLSGNPFFCDCNLQWLKDAFTLKKNNSHASIIIQDQNAVFCQLTHKSEPILMKEIPTPIFICSYVENCVSTICNCCENVKCNCRTKCPQGCNCYRSSNWQDADTVYCPGANLTSIPTDISTTCTALFFSGNNLSYLSSGNFDGLSSLGVLDLKACQLREIDDGSFKWLSKLWELDLSYNFLRSLNARMFEGLESLISLSVSFNQIYMIEYGTFHSPTFAHIR